MPTFFDSTADAAEVSEAQEAAQAGPSPMGMARSLWSVISHQTRARGNRCEGWCYLLRAGS